MELAAKGTIIEYIEKEHVLVDADFINWVIEQLTAILTQLDGKGILHGDIKPGNLLIVDASIKLCDFSNSMELEREQPKSCLTTVDYAAPEMLQLSCPSREPQRITSKSDFYSVGLVVMYLSGEQHPYYPTPTNLSKMGDQMFPVMVDHVNNLPRPLQVRGARFQIPPEMNVLFHRLTAVDAKRRGSLAELQRYVGKHQKPNYKPRIRLQSQAEKLASALRTIKDHQSELEQARLHLQEMVDLRAELAGAKERARLAETKLDQPTAGLNRSDDDVLNGLPIVREVGLVSNSALQADLEADLQMCMNSEVESLSLCF